MPTLYKRRVAQGLCGSCGKKNDADTSLCTTCKQAHKERAEAQRKQRQADRRCSDCQKKLRAKDAARCVDCRAKRNAKRKEAVEDWRGQGLCTSCGNGPSKDGCTLCQTCIDNRSEVSSQHYQARKEAGTCYYCNKKPAKGSTMCTRHRKLQKDYKVKIKLEALEAYGGPECSECDEDDIAILEIDHIKGGGGKHRRDLKTGGGHPFYLWLRRNNYPKGYRVLCPTCNKKAYAGVLS